MPAETSKSRAEGEGFDALAETLRQAVAEMQKKPSITLHRAADIGDDNERARLSTWPAPGKAQNLATVVEALAQRPPKIEAPPLAGALASRKTLAETPNQIRDQLANF